jgi:hypothetical protein
MSWTGSTCDEPGWGVRSNVDLRPLRCTKAHRRGRKRERGARGARLGPHRSSGGGVAIGRRGGAVVAGEAHWGGVPVWEGRREELSEVWNALGVIGVAFIGPGEGCRDSEGGVTVGEGGFNGRVIQLITTG